MEEVHRAVPGIRSRKRAAAYYIVSLPTSHAHPVGLCFSGILRAMAPAYGGAERDPDVWRAKRPMWDGRETNRNVFHNLATWVICLEMFVRVVRLAGG